MKPKRCLTHALFGVLAMPLGSADGWEVLQFRGIPAHQVTFSNAGLRIKVQSSAGPIIRPLPKPLLVQRLTAQGRVSSAFRMPAGMVQGSKGADDFALRIGLVVRGQKRLNWLQKTIAPKWVKRLHSLAPEGLGVDRIEFFNLVDNSLPRGGRRVHPLSHLLVENYIQTPGKDGIFQIDHHLQQPLETIAIWLSIDGDDLKLTYELTLESLRLSSQEP